MNSIVTTEADEKTAWVERARAGDLVAYDRLVCAYQAMAAGYAFSLLGDAHLAEDAAQEAFIEAYCELPKLREPTALGTWLRRIVFKQCDRILRRKRVATVSLETAETAPAGLDPAGVLERKATRELVHAAIAGLPEPQRTVVLLFYMSGQSQTEIARFLDVPLHTVKNRLHAARLNLKRSLIMNLEELQESGTPGEGIAERVVGLIAAARAGDVMKVEQLLGQEPGLAREKSEGATALHFASWFAHPQIARLLVLHGADLNLRDAEHNSPPIGWARESGQYEMVEFLLELGAKLDICQAAGLNRLDLVTEILEQEPGLIHYQSGWGSPLHEAAGWGHPEMLKFLLARGADPALKNTRGETALDVALIQRNGAPNTPYVSEEERERIAGACGEIETVLGTAGGA